MSFASPASGVKTVAASGASSSSAASSRSRGSPFATGQPLQPGRCVHDVVALLATDLVDELAQRDEGRGGQSVETGGVRGVVEESTGDRHRPVAAAVVEQAGVAVLVGLAVVGDAVGVATVGPDFGEERVERRRVPELVLGERAHRHVLLEERRDARPLRVGEADDELVVGHGEQQLVDGVPSRRIEARGECRPDRRHVSPPADDFARPARAFGLACPDCSRAAASLSRIT